MEITFTELQSLLLSTVWGVILLGAVGSILGGIIIFLVKKSIAKFVANLKHNFPKNRLFYPFYRSILLGQNIKELKGKEHQDADFILFAMRATLMSAIDLILFFLISFLTAIVAIFWGLERPILLTSLLSLSMLSAFAWLKSGVYSLSLIAGETYEAGKEINKSIPKKYQHTQKESGSEA
jgi:hypothetical protein